MNRTPFFTDLPVPDTLFSGGRVCGLARSDLHYENHCKADNACHNDSKSSLSGYAYCQKISPQGQQPYFRTNYPAKINIASLTKHPGTCFALVFRNGNIRPEYFKPGLLKLRCSLCDCDVARCFSQYIKRCLYPERNDVIPFHLRKIKISNLQWSSQKTPIATSTFSSFVMGSFCNSVTELSSQRSTSTASSSERYCRFPRFTRYTPYRSGNAALIWR